jgi:hypothetical protein
MHPRPIFYLLATISYTKGKQKLKKEEWIVTKYETAREIMVNDAKTMDSLKRPHLRIELQGREDHRNCKD